MYSKVLLKLTIQHKSCILTLGVFWLGQKQIRAYISQYQLYICIFMASMHRKKISFSNFNVILGTLHLRTAVLFLRFQSIPLDGAV